MAAIETKTREPFPYSQSPYAPPKGSFEVHFRRAVPELLNTVVKQYRYYDDLPKYHQQPIYDAQTLRNSPWIVRRHYHPLFEFAGLSDDTYVLAVRRIVDLESMIQTESDRTSKAMHENHEIRSRLVASEKHGSLQRATIQKLGDANKQMTESLEQNRLMIVKISEAQTVSQNIIAQRNDVIARLGTEAEDIAFQLTQMQDRNRELLIRNNEAEMSLKIKTSALNLSGLPTGPDTGIRGASQPGEGKDNLVAYIHSKVLQERNELVARLRNFEPVASPERKHDDDGIAGGLVGKLHQQVVAERDRLHMEVRKLKELLHEAKAAQNVDNNVQKLVKERGVLDSEMRQQREQLDKPGGANDGKLPEISMERAALQGGTRRQHEQIDQANAAIKFNSNNTQRLSAERDKLQVQVRQQAEELRQAISLIDVNNDNIQRLSTERNDLQEKIREQEANLERSRIAEDTKIQSQAIEVERNDLQLQVEKLREQLRNCETEKIDMDGIAAERDEYLAQVLTLQVQLDNILEQAPSSAISLQDLQQYARRAEVAEQRNDELQYNISGPGGYISQLEEWQKIPKESIDVSEQLHEAQEQLKIMRDELGVITSEKELYEDIFTGETDEITKLREVQAQLKEAHKSLEETQKELAETQEQHFLICEELDRLGIEKSFLTGNRDAANSRLRGLEAERNALLRHNDLLNGHLRAYERMELNLVQASAWKTLEGPQASNAVELPGPPASVRERISLEDSPPSNKTSLFGDSDRGLPDEDSARTLSGVVQNTAPHHSDESNQGDTLTILNTQVPKPHTMDKATEVTTQDEMERIQKELLMMTEERNSSHRELMNAIQRENKASVTSSQYLLQIEQLENEITRWKEQDTLNTSSHQPNINEVSRIQSLSEDHRQKVDEITTNLNQKEIVIQNLRNELQARLEALEDCKRRGDLLGQENSTPKVDVESTEMLTNELRSAHEQITKLEQALEQHRVLLTGAYEKIERLHTEVLKRGGMVIGLFDEVSGEHVMAGSYISPYGSFETDFHETSSPGALSLQGNDVEVGKNQPIPIAGSIMAPDIAKQQAAFDIQTVRSVHRAQDPVSNDSSTGTLIGDIKVTFSAGIDDKSIDLTDEPKISMDSGPKVEPSQALPGRVSPPPVLSAINDKARTGSLEGDDATREPEQNLEDSPEDDYKPPSSARDAQNEPIRRPRASRAPRTPSPILPKIEDKVPIAAIEEEEPMADEPDINIPDASYKPPKPTNTAKRCTKRNPNNTYANSHSTKKQKTTSEKPTKIEPSAAPAPGLRRSTRLKNPNPRY